MHKLDTNDIKHIKECFDNVIGGTPCPIGEGGKINPHVSKFALADGRAVSVFHVKPIYYLHKCGGWRPMEEVAEGFGNTWIDLKSDWNKKMDEKYLSWLLKRMKLVRGKLNIPSPYNIKVAGKTANNLVKIYGNSI